eukprot:g7944.t1
MRVGLAASIGGISTVCYVAYRGRPRFHEEPPASPAGCAPAAPPAADWGEGLADRIAQDFFLGLSQLVTMPVFSLLNDLEVHGAQNLRDAWAQRHERPLLTVCNHHSCLDEVLVPRLLADGFVRSGSENMRWGLCRQDVGFKTPVTAAYFGAMKALPVRRGAGLGQPGVALAAQKLVRGGWVHVYPEGRIWQGFPVGGSALRPDDGEKYVAPAWQQPYRPYLRWGVGKIAADAPVPPRIVAYYHTGMADVQPQGSRDERLVSWKPRAGNRVVVRVGEPFDVDDLLAAHRCELERLRLGTAGRGTVAAREEHERRAEALRHKLYSDITRVVQEELLRLEAKVRAEYGLASWAQQQPGKRSLARKALHVTLWRVESGSGESENLGGGVLATALAQEQQGERGSTGDRLEAFQLRAAIEGSAKAGNWGQPDAKEAAD